jgi:hypothetical protein
MEQAKTSGKISEEQIKVPEKQVKNGTKVEQVTQTEDRPKIPLTEQQVK